MWRWEKRKERNWNAFRIDIWLLIIRTEFIMQNLVDYQEWAYSQFLSNWATLEESNWALIMEMNSSGTLGLPLSWMWYDSLALEKLTKPIKIVHYLTTFGFVLLFFLKLVRKYFGKQIVWNVCLECVCTGDNKVVKMVVLLAWWTWVLLKYSYPRSSLAA